MPGGKGGCQHPSSPPPRPSDKPHMSAATRAPRRGAPRLSTRHHPELPQVAPTGAQHPLLSTLHAEARPGFTRGSCKHTLAVNPRASPLGDVSGGKAQSLSWITPAGPGLAEPGQSPLHEDGGSCTPTARGVAPWHPAPCGTSPPPRRGGGPDGDVPMAGVRGSLLGVGGRQSPLEGAEEAPSSLSTAGWLGARGRPGISREQSGCWQPASPAAGGSSPRERSPAEAGQFVFDLPGNSGARRERERHRPEGQPG